MNVPRLILQILIVSVVALVLPRSSQASCVYNTPVAEAWSSWVPDLHIPVYVVASGRNSVASTGHEPEDIARIVHEVIARHNESVAVPKLRFAGFSSDRWYEGADFPHADLDIGITIMSYECGHLKPETEEDLCDALSKEVHACGGFAGKPNCHTRGWILLLPAGCDKIPTPDDKWTLWANPDLAGVMLHEIGHTLGLKHANMTQTECENDGGIHVGDPDGATGVMHAVSPGKYAAYRSWRRDDLEGLDFLYHTLTGAFELARWNDDEYPHYPAEDEAISLTGMSVTRSATVSNQPGVGWQVLATTGPDNRVHHRVVDALGGTAPDLGLTPIDLQPSGRTWGMPAAAGGWAGSDPRIFVAWFANEETSTTTVDLRVATRSVTDLDWTFEDHPDPFRVNRLAAGFVPSPESFVVTTMHENTSEIMLLLFDTNGASLGPAMVLEGIPAFDVGAPVCTGSRCLIPYSDPVFGGPDFGIVEVEVTPAESVVTVIGQEVIPELDTHGRLALFEREDHLLATIGAGRIALGSWPGIAADGELEQAEDDWPLGLGHWTHAGEIDEWRMFQPRTLSCGNGIVQAGESCDDMNDIAGDGCHACALEPQIEDDSDTNDGANGYDEVGDHGGTEEPGEGCECRAARTGTLESGLAMLALLAIRRHRRSCRPLAS